MNQHSPYTFRDKQAVVFFGAPPTSPLAAALTALLSYVVLAAIAYWIDKKRTSISLL